MANQLVTRTPPRGTRTRRKPFPLGKLFVYLILAFLTLTFIFPYLWLIASSFKDPVAVKAAEFSLIPRDSVTGQIRFLFENYKSAFFQLNLGQVFLNTMIVCVVNTAVNLFLNSLAAYAFARLRFPGKKALFSLLLATMMVPGTVLLIPNIIVVNFFGIYDTLLALILPFLMSVYNVFLLRQQFYALSGSIEEAARIDGAGNFRIYWQIALPLVSPILVVQGITTFMWNYNNFLWPLVATQSSETYTLARSLGVLFFSGQNEPANYPIMLAGAVIVSAPMILLYFCLQKYIVGGLSLGAVKE